MLDLGWTLYPMTGGVLIREEDTGRKAAISQRRPGVTRNWKRQGRILPPEPSERGELCQHLDFRLLASKSVRG